MGGRPGPAQRLVTRFNDTVSKEWEPLLGHFGPEIPLLGRSVDNPHQRKEKMGE